MLTASALIVACGSAGAGDVPTHSPPAATSAAQTSAPDPATIDPTPAASTTDAVPTARDGREAWELFFHAMAERDAATFCGFMVAGPGLDGCIQGMAASFEHMDDDIIDAAGSIRLDAIVERDGLACLDIREVMAANPEFYAAFAAMTGTDEDVTDLEDADAISCMELTDGHWLQTAGAPQ